MGLKRFKNSLAFFYDKMAFLDDFIERGGGKLLIDHPAGIGDNVMGLTAYWAIRNKVGDDIIIGLVVQDRAEDLAQNFTLPVNGRRAIDQIHVLDKRLSRREKKRILTEELRKERYNTVVNFGDCYKNTWIAKRSGARFRTGPCIWDARDPLSWWFATHRIPHQKPDPELEQETLHKVDKLMGMARFLGADSREYCFDMEFSDEQRARAREVTERFGTRVVGLQIGSSKDYKTWPVGHFRKLGELFVDREYQVVVFGGETDLARQELFRKSGSRLYDNKFIYLVNRYDFPTDMLIAKNMGCVFSSDTSFGHATASIMGVPVISLFGPTNIEMYHPFYKDGRKPTVIRSEEWDCYPSGEKRRCKNNYSRNKCGGLCMSYIMPIHVIDQFEKN